MDKLVSRFRKNSTEEIQVRITEYMNKQLIDVRVWAGPRGEETVPTKKGVSIPAELFGAFKEAIEATEDILKTG